MPKKVDFVFTLFDYSGRVDGQTSKYEYIYFVDGAVVREVAKKARFSTGRALNYLKERTGDNVYRRIQGEETWVKLKLPA
jgi:hypothetical protein